MSCNKQLYRITYPEKNVVGYTPTAPPDFRKEVAETCRRYSFTPTSENQCSSTFMPWDRPSPVECAMKCGTIPKFAMDACAYESHLYKSKIPGLGCLGSPAQTKANYTNVPMAGSVALGPGCAKKTCKNYPNPPEYGQKGSSVYDPILYSFGKPYTF